MLLLNPEFMATKPVEILRVNSYHSCYSPVMTVDGSDSKPWGQLLSWLLLDVRTRRPFRGVINVNSYHSCYSTGKRGRGNIVLKEVNSYHSCYSTHSFSDFTI